MKTEKFFSTKRLVTLALFVAMAYVLSFLSFPIFPVTPYIKLDFGNIFILLPALLFGPVEGILVCFVKELISTIGSSTHGIGELGNFLITSSYIIIPAVVYKYKKGVKPVLVSLVFACVVGILAALAVNRFITFPAFMGSAGPAVFEEVFYFIVAFNAIKTVSISIISFLLYKRLSGFLKTLNVK